MSPAKRPHPRERGEQAGIVKLLRSLGAQVYVLGTTRRHGDHPGTMQTPGLSDVYCILPAPPDLPLGPRLALWIEVKAHGGRLRPAQVEFRTACLSANVAHLVGGLDDVIAWLLARGYLWAQSERRP